MSYPYTNCASRYKVPAKVAQEAKKGLEMHKRGFMGGTTTGWARARQLATCGYVSAKTIKTMKAWFARHTYTSYPGYTRWVRAGKPMTLTSSNKRIYRGAVAWLIWGGDAGKKWVAGIKL